MSTRVLLALVCVAELVSLITAGGGGGGHKKVIIHVPLFVKHHHHKHTIVKHIHHKDKEGGDDHYEVLGYTYGEPKGHFSGGHVGGWKAADETDVIGFQDSPVVFKGGDETGYQFGGDESYNSDDRVFHAH